MMYIDYIISKKGDFMKRYSLLILLVSTLCLGINNKIKNSDKIIEEFYQNYNFYKIEKMYDRREEVSKGISEKKDKCIIDYLSKEIKNKRTDYKYYLSKLQVKNTGKYDKLIIELAIKSASSLSEDWNFMHEYLRNIEDIERLYKQLTEYSIDDKLSFFLVYFMYYGDTFPDLNEIDYIVEVEKIKKFDNLKKELPMINKRFKEFDNWDLRTEGGLIERIGEKYQNSSYEKSFFINISNSIKIHGRIYNNKDFVILMEKMNPDDTRLKIIYEEFIDINNIQIYTYGFNFFVIKKSENNFTLTKYSYNIKESKLEILDKVNLKNCF